MLTEREEIVAGDKNSCVIVTLEGLGDMFIHENSWVFRSNSCVGKHSRLFVPYLPYLPGNLSNHLLQNTMPLLKTPFLPSRCHTNFLNFAIK